MKYISTLDFIVIICKDYGIDWNTIDRLKLPNNTKTITNFTKGRAARVMVVNQDDSKSLLMIDWCKRDEEALNNGKELICIRRKSLHEVIKELNLNLESKKVQISEGNGWYSTGYQYFYKDNYCEI